MSGTSRESILLAVPQARSQDMWGQMYGVKLHYYIATSTPSLPTSGLLQCSLWS